MQEPTILGISPGKEMMGVALIHKGALIDWRIRTTKKSDSSVRYMNFIKTVSRTHSVSAIALKVSAHPRSAYRKKLIAEIKAHCGEAGIEYKEFPISFLKKLVLRQEYKTLPALMKAIAEKKPELIPMLRKERKNRNTYYIKIFEAVAAALMTEKIMNARNAVTRLSR